MLKVMSTRKILKNKINSIIKNLFTQEESSLPIMKEKHKQIRIRQCLDLSKASNCPRRKVGALLIDPFRNVILMDGYNGGPRQGSKLCGGDCCIRTKQNIESGTQIQIGCHHAEMNVICNSAANGVETEGAWMIVNCQPCLMCAKLIHHAGIKKVITIANTYNTSEGVSYLVNHGIFVEQVKESDYE